MTVRSGVDAWLLVGGYSLTGYLTDFEEQQEAKTEEITVLGTSFQQHGFVGVRDSQFSLNGFYDNAVGGLAEFLTQNQGVSRVLAYGLEGTATGQRFVGWAGAWKQKFEIHPARDALTKMKGDFKTNGVVEEGRVIRPLGAATATGFGAGNAVSASGQTYNFGASNVSGAAAYMVITSLQATASGFQCDIMHSADNLTFSSYAAFTAVSATAPNSTWSQRINSTAPIQQYVTERHVDAGGSSFTSAIFFVGVAPR